MVGAGVRVKMNSIRVWIRTCWKLIWSNVFRSIGLDVLYKIHKLVESARIRNPGYYLIIPRVEWKSHKSPFNGTFFTVEYVLFGVLSIHLAAIYPQKLENNRVLAVQIGRNISKIQGESSMLVWVLQSNYKSQFHAYAMDYVNSEYSAYAFYDKHEYPYTKIADRQISIHWHSMKINSK